MWDLLYTGGENYRLALYSPLGTLEACLVHNEEGFSSCGGKSLNQPQVFRILPPSLLARLPQILLGYLPYGEISRDKKGRTTEAHLLLEGKSWTITYSHYLKAEETPYPTLVVIKGEEETLKIRVEEMTPNWSPSAG